MKYSHTFIAFSLWILVLGGLSISTTSAWAAGTRPEAADAPINNFQMTQEELQSAVISYASSFMATIGQAAFDFEKALPTPEGRLNAAQRKVLTLSAAVEIATGPNAGPALLDMVVMATLNRMVWEEYWRPQVFGMPASIMVDAFKRMEEDAWDLTSKVMTPAQLEEFRDLIIDWRSTHLEQRAVDYIRFSDFGGLGKKPNLKEIQKPGGLLAPVREATAAVDEVRMTSEKAMFLLTKMQLIMGFQAELIYKEMVMQPEIEKLFTDISGFKTTADRFAGLLEQLPDQVANERAAIFTDTEKLIARERTAVIKAIDDKATVIHQVNKDVQTTLDRVDITFGNLQKTTTDAERLIQSVQQTILASQALVATVDEIAAKFEPTDPSAPSQPFDVNEYTALLGKMQATVDGLNQLTHNIDATSTPLITHLIGQFNNAADERVDHFFLRCFQFLLVTGVIVLVLIIVNKVTLSKKNK